MSKADLLHKLRLQEQISADQQATILQMQEQLDLLRKAAFGPKSERKGKAKPQKTPSETSSEEASPAAKKPPSKKQGTGAVRRALPAHLPRKEVRLEPEGDLRDWKPIGEEVSEKLAYTPGSLYVIRYIRPKYARPQEEEAGIRMAPAVRGVLPKGNVDSSFLAHLLISKFEDHLPMYRLVKIFQRQGIALSEGSMSGWLHQAWVLLTPLYELLRQKVLKSDYLQADETPIKVLAYGKNKEKKIKQAYFWVYRAPLSGQLFFDYQETRGKDGPEELLAPFSGVLQSDGYVAYDKIVAKRPNEITHMFCHAHARRKFYEAQTNHAQLAGQALDFYARLYAIEAQIKEKPPDERKKVRQEKAAPIMEAFGRWLDQCAQHTLSSMAIGKAVRYAQERWEGLCRYLHDGRLEIDNNRIENKIRPVALGRKNYLFVGSHTGGKRAALFYTFMALLREQQIDAQQWFEEVLDNIGDCPVTEIHQWLPQNYKKRKNTS